MLELIQAIDIIDDQGNAPFGTGSDLELFKTRIYEDNLAALSLTTN